MSETSPADFQPPELKRVLVTGATGVIGTAVTAALAEAGVAITSLSLAGPSPLADRNVVADARDLDAIAEALSEVDAVVHLAAIVQPDETGASRVFTVNTEATFNVLTEAAARGIKRLVYASSINAVGTIFSPHDLLFPYVPLDEAAPNQVADSYSLSKQCDELTGAMVARRWGATVVGLRFPYTATAEKLRARAASYRLDPKPGAREAWSYLDVEDAAAAVLAALTHPIEPGAYHVLLSADDTLLDLPTDEALATYAPRLSVRRPILGHSSAIDYSAARTLFGFSPTRSVHAKL